MSSTVRESVDAVAQKALRHLKRNAGREVGFKELVNICDTRPERVKDALTHMMTVECLPIKASGGTYTYANSKVRRNAAREVSVNARTGAKAAPQSLNGELGRIQESLLELAAKVEDLDRRVKAGTVSLPRKRDALTEGAALRTIREDRGVDQGTIATWLGKTEHYIAELEDGKRAMTADEAREFVRELRMDAAVFNARLGQGQPVFDWSEQGA